MQHLHPLEFLAHPEAVESSAFEPALPGVRYDGMC